MTYLSVKRGLETILDSASQQQLEDLRHLIIEELRKRYPSNEPRYGNLSRSFSEDELARFYNAIENPKYALLFKCQSFLGLRIGEAVALKVTDIRHDTRELVLITEKSRKLDRVFIPSGLYSDLCSYISRNEGEIESHRGYLFFPDPSARSFGDHITSHRAGVLFRRAAKKAGILEVYGYSQEKGRVPRPLHRLTTHSHRHYSITTFYKASKDLVLTNKYARHSMGNYRDTMRYDGTDRSEMYRIHEAAFSTGMKQKRISVLQEKL